MARMAKIGLFSWKEVEVRSDLDRLRMVLEMMPDGGLMMELEAHRDKGLDDSPLRAM